MIHIDYWLTKLDEKINESDYEKLMFELDGLDFYKFFYNGSYWYPVDFINTCDGKILENNKISEITYKLKDKEIEFILENHKKLILTDNDFLKAFNIRNQSEIPDTVSKLYKSGKLYFDGGHYYFLNETEYNKVMLYLHEQIDLLNKIYRSLKLPQINIC